MNKKERTFVTTVWSYYDVHGRQHLPWRKTKNPYRILVSEVMLQQTQVERVIPKYAAFIKRFPTVQSLADASLRDVLSLWQGLGYNRRARYLQQTAAAIMIEYKGRFSKTYSELVALPGVGKYTAAAIMNFAYNIATPLIETNLRTIFIHHFYKGKENVHDTELMPLIERTMDRERPRLWFSALMDYGAFLKQTGKGRNSKSRHYKKQSPFVGSNREIRGAIVKQLIKNKSPVSELGICTLLENFESKRVLYELAKLVNEGLVHYKNKKYSI